ncbi:MAG: PTS sugar transporter subunit IIA [Lentisphaerae bacterium]|nr:PTS sugar transporter subunit IIA [Lentisphaerota bacterium]
MAQDVKKIALSELLGDRVFILKGKQQKSDVFKVLIDSVAEVEGMIQREDLEWGVLHRETIMSTGIGNGIAVPHVRSENIEKACMALAIVPDGVSDYQSPDMKPVQLVFLIAAGGTQRAKHLKILSAIGSLFYDGRLKAAFLASSDAKNCLEILTRAEG